MPHFFARRQGDRVEIVGSDARHLAGPLRARPGELIKVVEPEGRLLTVRLESVSAGTVVGTVLDEVAYDPEPRRRVNLALAMLPAAALEQVLSRGTEVGAASFTVVSAERSVARGARAERWATICREAAMLAGRLRVPEVVGPVTLAEAWARAGRPWLLDRSAELRLADLELSEEVGLFVGPEGGWTAAEVATAGGRVLSLGPRNLRAETAALVALAVALAGD